MWAQLMDYHQQYPTVARNKVCKRTEVNASATNGSETLVERNVCKEKKRPMINRAKKLCTWFWKHCLKVHLSC
jgi:hypothetical protein